MTEADEQPLVTILTLNFNGKQFLPALFKSLRKVSYPNLEIIMADNASTDDSVDFVKTNFPEVKIVQHAENFMFARGNNEALKFATGKYICVINNDTFVESDFLNSVVSCFEKNDKVAAIQPKLLAANTPHQLEYAGACGGFIDQLGYCFARGRIFEIIEDDQSQYNEPLQIFWASGACIFLRATAIEQSGGFDDDFMMHMEEVDLCWRLQLLDWKIISVPQSVVYHVGGGTLDVLNPQKMYWNFRNNVFMMLKNWSFLNLVVRLLIRIPLDFLAFIVELLKQKPKHAAAILRAYSWILLNLGLILKKRAKVQEIRCRKDSALFPQMYSGSIVFEYFVLKNTVFSKLLNVQKLLRKSQIDIY